MIRLVLLKVELTFQAYKAKDKKKMLQFLSVSAKHFMLIDI